MKSLVTLKTSQDSLEVEYKIWAPLVPEEQCVINQISEKINILESLMTDNKIEIEKLNIETV